MNIRFLETFLWITRLGSFRAAAAKLHLTQAAVSGRIAALESELEQQLFERGSREIHLTQAGRTLMRYAEQMLTTDEEMRKALLGPRVLHGSVRLGIVESVIHTWFTPFIKHLHEAHPKLEIELTVESTRRLHDLLKRGAIDVILQTDPVIEEGVRNRPLGMLKMGWICNANADMEDDITLAELAAHWPIITFPRHSQPHLSLLELIEQADISSPRIHFVSSIAASTQLIGAGLGVGILPVAALRAGIQQGIYRLINCTSLLPDLRLVVSWRPDPQAGVAEAVVAMAIKEMQRYAGATPDAVAPMDSRALAL